MINEITDKRLIKLLKKRNFETGLLNQLKISYRPLICPFNMVLKQIEEKKSIFDIGCGSGQFLLILAEFMKPSKLGGIEISSELVNNAKNILFAYNGSIPVDISTFDGESIPDNIYKYDIVTLLDVLHHVPREKQVSFLRQIVSRMKPGANLILKDINREFPMVWVNKIHDLMLSGEIGHEIHYKKVVSLLKDVKLEIISVEKTNKLWYPHYVIKAIKN